MSKPKWREVKPTILLLDQLAAFAELLLSCAVEKTEKDSASVLLLKMLDGRGCILPVYIGS